MELLKIRFFAKTQFLLAFCHIKRIYLEFSRPEISFRVNCMGSIELTSHFNLRYFCLRLYFRKILKFCQDNRFYINQFYNVSERKITYLRERRN